MARAYQANKAADKEKARMAQTMRAFWRALQCEPSRQLDSHPPVGCASREKRQTGGDGGIRTLDPGFGPDAPL